MQVQELIQKEEIGALNMERHFQCYFHNKMTVLLTMIDHPFLYHEIGTIERERISIDDMYRYFTPYGVKLKYRRAFRWLSEFLRQFPNVDERRLAQARKMVHLVYDAFGFRWNACGPE